MQNQNLPLLSIHRENYCVPKGEEQVVHYKAEKVLFDPKDGTRRLSHPDLIKTNVKMFDDVKRNLELQGYVIEILHHPLGKYTNVVVPADPMAELAAKDDEIARLRAELAAQMEATKGNAPQKEEAKAENPSEKEEAKTETPSVKKGGRTKKSE